LIVHACHCRWCQRETGTAHALNALYEADRVVHTAGEPEIVSTPSASGKGQMIARCPTCRVAIWSNYPQAGPAIRFVRVGTMDNPDLCPPDIHIFTSSRQPWVTLPPSARTVSEFYVLDAVWPAESLERLRIMRAKAQQAQSGRTELRWILRQTSEQVDPQQESMRDWWFCAQGEEPHERHDEAGKRHPHDRTAPTTGGLARSASRSTI